MAYIANLATLRLRAKFAKLSTWIPYSIRIHLAQVAFPPSWQDAMTSESTSGLPLRAFGEEMLRKAY